MSFTRKVSVLAVLFVVTAACSTGTGDTRAQSPAPAPRLGDVAPLPDPPGAGPLGDDDGSFADTPAEVKLPLEDIGQMSWDDARALEIAVQTKIASCMRDLGWPYEIPEFPLSAPDLPDRRYGYTAQDLNRLVPPDSGGPATESEKSEGGGGLPTGLDPGQAEAWKHALGGKGFIWVADGAVGIPDGGCIAAAEEEIIGDRVAHSELKVRLQVWMNETWQASRSDSEVVAVMAEWQRCMARAGWEFTDPLEVANVSFDLGVADPRVQADVDCKEETRLVEVWSRVESRYQEQILAQHETVILAWQEQRAEAIQRARQLVDG